MADFYMDDLIGILIVIVVAFLIPATITIWNIWNLLAKKRLLPRLALVVTLVVGLVEYLILNLVVWELAGDYNEVINTAQLHYRLYSKNLLSFILPCGAGLVGLLILGFSSIKKTPPLVTAFSVAAVVIGNVMQIMFAVQISKNVKDLEILFYVFHLNVLLLSIQWIYRRIVEQVEVIKERKTQFRYVCMEKFYRFLASVSNMSIFSFLMVLPVALIIWLILILLGQGPDGVVKVFTMTADWTFSTQIPPPPVEYEGHYLCTVAAGGHKQVVKPLRFGKRKGQAIIVNRQLCVANAFEQLIEERLPRFHKWVRSFYDTHGYPVSQVITTPLRADVIYILMKPLEWIFLIVLYLFDSNPEQRIATQYEWR